MEYHQTPCVYIANYIDALLSCVGTRCNCVSGAVAGRTLLTHTLKKTLSHTHHVCLIMWRPLTKLLPNTFPTIILKSGFKKKRESENCFSVLPSLLHFLI